MGDFFKFVNDGGTVAWIIVGLGCFGAALIIERIKVLYFEYNMNASEFSQKVQSYVLGNKIEEAIALCSANPKSPLAYIIKGILERSDRDDQAMQQVMDIRYSEVLPKLSRRFGYLMMLSNVATLMGLLGTIHGLMISFEAVSFADPAQKQTILTQGIAMYMSATALGLGVAIPIMFAYAFLHARQGRLMNEIVEHTSKVMDLLCSRNYEAFDKSKVYATSDMPMDNKKMPPAPPKKVA
ncbi:MAG: MotA/TolQ/ExbB proton channel family protein [Bdellovibrionales bacterium]